MTLNKTSNNLAIIATNIGSIGGINHIKNLIKYLNKDQKFNRVIIWGNKKIKDHISLENANYKLIVSERSQLANFFWRVFLLPKKIQKYQCKSTISMDGVTNFSSKTQNYTFFQNLIPFNARTILEYKYSKKIYKFLIINLISKISSFYSDGYIFTSEHSKKLIYNKLYKKKPYLIVPHGVNEIFYTEKREWQKQSDTIKIICVSQFDIYKNYINLLKAIRKLIQQNEKVSLTLVGSISDISYYNKCLKIIKSINSIKPNTIILKGELKDIEIKKLFKEHDLMIYPSICESWGMALQEAIVGGLPVICSNQLGHEKYFREQISFFDPFNSDDIADKIIESKKKKKIDLSIPKDNEIYNWSISINKFLNFISQNKDINKKKFKIQNFFQIFPQQLNINNYFVYNFYSILSVFFILYFFNHKELSTFFSIIYGLNNLFYFSLSANLKNLILSNNDFKKINSVSIFRMLFSFITIIANYFFIKHFLNQKFIYELLILSFITTLPWIKEIILCKFINKNDLIRKIFLIDIIQYVLGIGLIFYDVEYFILYLLAMGLLNYLVFFSQIKLKKLNFKIHELKYLNIFFFSSLSISFSTLLIRIIVEHYQGPTLAADFILFYSLVTFPATLFTNTFGINMIKNELPFPTIMKILITTYFIGLTQYFIFEKSSDIQFLLFIGSLCGLIMIIFSYIRLVYFNFKDTIKKVLRNDIFISFLNILLLIIFVNFEINLYYFMIPVAIVSFCIMIMATSKFQSIK